MSWFLFEWTSVQIKKCPSNLQYALLREQIHSFRFLSLGNRLKELPTSLCSMKCLRMLDVRENRITTLPRQLCNVRTLETLMVDADQMTYPPSGNMMNCLHDMSHLVGKPTMWFPNRSDTNQAAQSQKQARSLKFRQKRKCTIRVAKTKALISFAVTALAKKKLLSHDAAHM